MEVETEEAVDTDTVSRIKTHSVDSHNTVLQKG